MMKQSIINIFIIIIISFSEYINEEHYESLNTLITNISLCINLYPHYNLCDEINDYISTLNIDNIKESEYEECNKKLCDFISKYNVYLLFYIFLGIYLELYT